MPVLRGMHVACSALMSSDSPAAPAISEMERRLVSVTHELAELERRLLALEQEMAPALERVAVDRRESARNLVHYVALRQHDLRDLQVRLAELGLSSLGRSESCVRGSLFDVSERAHEALLVRGSAGARSALERLSTERGAAMSWETAKHCLHQHTRDILGPRPDDRHIYVMVTTPGADEADRIWIARMLRAGMNVLRINCAHEGEVEWERMVRALDEARRETGKECRLLMDLAGPKIRTGPVIGARRIATWKPGRDDIGRATTPARVILRPASSPHTDGAKPVLAVDDAAFGTLRQGDALRFRDARGKKRALCIEEVRRDEVVGTSTARAYVLGSALARLSRRGEDVGDVTLDVVEGASAAIDVCSGDTLVLTRRAVAGKPPLRDRAGGILESGLVSCTLPAALDHLERGHRVLFDDGRIEAVVESVEGKLGDFMLRVVRTQKRTERLRAERGINFPDTETTVPSVTDDDRRALAFVARHADAVGLSFVRRTEDVRHLHEELDRLDRAGIGVVLKIETRSGFENLPRLLLEGLCRPPLAVMIARGDLAVEVGFERLAELQEEILWLCEASHVPAIWATQVLDTLARTGVPSRAEVTDAAASVAAECVMLNKGPFVGEAVAVLSGILRRMEKHHYKKRSLFRKLRVSTFG